MNIYRAEVRMNNQRIWRQEEGIDKNQLMGRLLHQMAREQNSADGFIVAQSPRELIFQCRKSKNGATELLHLA